MYNTYFWLIVSILIMSHMLGVYLDIINGRMWSDIVPSKLKDIIDHDRYRISQNYYRENRRVSNIAATINLGAVLLILSLGGFAWLDSFVRSFVDKEVFITVFFFALIGLSSDLAHLPFKWYGTFVIEEKYGFNKTSTRTFIADHIKTWLLSLAIGGPLLILIAWIFNESGESFWILIWIVITLFSLFMNLFYSELIVPLFNKQKLLEEGELRDKIEKIALSAGFKLSNIYTIDGSKRSTRANAYFSGLGRKKRIVLYDTLSNDLTDNEITAVLSHEMGHYKRRHNLIFLAAGILQTGLMLYIFSLLSGNTGLTSALGGTTPSFHLSLLAFVLVYSPVSFLLSIIMNYISRRHEYEADKFAASIYSADELASALKKLSLKNLSNLNPHPRFVFFYYSHPPLLQRLKALEGS